MVLSRTLGDLPEKTPLFLTWFNSIEVVSLFLLTLSFIVKIKNFRNKGSFSYLLPIECDVFAFFETYKLSYLIYICNSLDAT